MNKVCIFCMMMLGDVKFCRSVCFLMVLTRFCVLIFFLLYLGFGSSSNVELEGFAYVKGSET